MQAFEFLAPIEAKLAANTGELTGYASTFGNTDLGGDVVAPGAFAKSLAEHKANDSMPAMLWSHDPAEPVGVWLEAQEDTKGLLVRGKLTMDTKRGAEARALAKDGALALSIGYATQDAVYENGRRVLKEVALFETSLVSVPMNPKAKIISVKSAVAADEIRSAVAFERFLKSHGFANSLARRLAAGWDAAVGRKQTDDAGAIAEAIKSSAVEFSRPTSRQGPELDPNDPHYEYWRDYYAGLR
jgi:uncharacterized protein